MRRKQERVLMSAINWMNMSKRMRHHWKIRRHLFQNDCFWVTLKARPAVKRD